MISDDYKMNDLKSWNNLQLKLLEELDSPAEPDYVTAVAEWFVRLVDDLGRLPSWEEIRAHFPTDRFSHGFNA